MYKDVAHFVQTCESCQMHSNVRHRDELHTTYPWTMHFKWMVDFVAVLTEGVRLNTWFLQASREDLAN